jgi:hypothetical protein
VLIKEITGSNSTIRMLPATKDDPKQRKPDITTAGRELEWRPLVPVRTGLTKAIDYFRKVSILLFIYSVAFNLFGVFCVEVILFLRLLILFHFFNCMSIGTRLEW